jgi:hypothetical protein
VKLTCTLCRNALCYAVLCSADPYNSERHKQQDVSQGIFGPEFAAFRNNQPLQQQRKYRAGTNSDTTASLQSLDVSEGVSDSESFDYEQADSQDADLELQQDPQQQQLQEDPFEPFKMDATDEPTVEMEQELAEQYAREDKEHRQQAAAEAKEAEREIQRKLQERQMLASADPAWQESEHRQQPETADEQMRAYEALARQEQERRQQIQADAEELDLPLRSQPQPGNVRRPVAADKKVQREVPKKYAPPAASSRDTYSNRDSNKGLSEAEELRRAFNVDWPQNTKQQALCWQ